MTLGALWTVGAHLGAAHRAARILAAIFAAYPYDARGRVRAAVGAGFANLSAYGVYLGPFCPASFLDCVPRGRSVGCED